MQSLIRLICYINRGANVVKVRNDLSGKVFGNLTVIEQSDDYVNPQGRHFARWHCVCICGNETSSPTSYDLTSGHTTSCGCYGKNLLGKSSKKYNRYDLSGEYCIGWTVNTNEPFYFDFEDYDKIKELTWSCYYQENVKMLKAYYNDTMVAFHQFLGYKYYDHINRNELDNRRENLRPATFTENARNRSLQSNNTSGVTGVSWSKQNKKWMVQITVNKKTLTIGFFDDKFDAIKARLEAEIKYFGAFAPQKHLYEQYGINIIE